MHLAQLNIAKAKASMESNEMKEFVDNLVPVNQIEESAAGFIWRLQDESGDATNIQVFSDANIIVNMSTWLSVDALKHFIFKTHHRNFLRRKKEWFDNIPENNYVLWWVPVGHKPTVEEGIEKLEFLRNHGESPAAFSFKNNFSETDHLENKTIPAN